VTIQRTEYDQGDNADQIDMGECDHYWAWSTAHANDAAIRYADSVERMGHNKRPLMIHNHRNSANAPCELWTHTYLQQVTE
jgi:hypothetical protein